MDRAPGAIFDARVSCAHVPPQTPQTRRHSLLGAPARLPSGEALASELTDLEVVSHALTLTSYVPEDQEEKIDVLDSLGLGHWVAHAKDDLARRYPSASPPL